MKTQGLSPLVVNLAIVVLGALFFLPGIGGVRLFDWDEINFAESAREMLLTGDWFHVQINFEPFWEKPPLFIWAQALSMKVFGVNEFAARFPNALMGIITLLTLFNLGRRHGGTRFGLLWAIMYGISFLPFFYFKSGIIDPWFNFFIFLGIYYLARYSESAGAGNAALSALFTGLAVLTKGPVGLLIVGLSALAWLISVRFRLSFRWKDVALWFAVLALIGGSWFIALAASGNGDVIRDFIAYQVRLFETRDAGHGGFMFYHFLILLFGVTPASFFALRALGRMPGRDGDVDEEAEATALSAADGSLRRWMTVSFWVVLILFTLVRTKIVHYSSFCYFPLSFLGALAAERTIEGKIRFSAWQRGMLIATAIGFGLLLAAITLFDFYKGALIPHVRDAFTASCMEATSFSGAFPVLSSILLIGTTVWFCISFSRKPDVRSFCILGAGNLLFGLTAICCTVPQVEKYSQDSAIEFYIDRRGEDCYVEPAYFKTYAHYFYTDRQPGNNCDDFEYLSGGTLDKPCYFVLQDIPSELERFSADVPDAEFLYRRSGFRFFVRPKTEQGSADKDGEGQQEGIE